MIPAELLDRVEHLVAERVLATPPFAHFRAYLERYLRAKQSA